MALYSKYNLTINDNCTTPLEIWKDVLPYIPKDKKVWCPFYYKGEHKLRELIDIIHNDEDFFEVNRGDIVVDNPPFSIKKQVLQRLLDLDKPFIMVMPVSTICYKYFKPFKDKIQIIVPNRRYNFYPEGKSTPSFDCLWYCYKVNLKQDIIFL